MADAVLYRVDIDIEAINKKLADVNAGFNNLQRQVNQIESLSRKAAAPQGQRNVATAVVEQQAKAIDSATDSVTKSLADMQADIENITTFSAQNLNQLLAPLDAIHQRAQTVVSDLNKFAGTSPGSAGVISPFPALDPRGAVPLPGPVDVRTSSSGPNVQTQGFFARIGEGIKNFFGIGKQIDDVSDGIEKKVGGALTITSDKVRQLGFAFERFGVSGAAAFGEIFKVIGPVGIAVGGLLIGVVAVTKALAALAKAGVAAFKELISSSVETARSFDITKAQFTAIFEGNTSAADATFERIRTLSRQLGTDVSEVARAFIPEVSSLKQLEDITRAAAALARFQPEQGSTGARIALQEAFSGNLTSLQRRFEISESGIDRIKALQEELGNVDGLIKGLNEELERTGRTFEDLGGTLDTSLGRAKEIFRDIKDEIGSPVVDELIEQFDALNEILQENEDEINVIANALGDALAGLVEFGGEFLQELFSNIDSDEVKEVAVQLRLIGENLQFIAQNLLGNDDLSSPFEALAGILEKINAALFGFTTTIKAISSINSVIGEAANGNAIGTLEELFTNPEVGQGIEDAIATLKTEFFQYGIAAGVAKQETEAFAEAQNTVAAGGEAAADAILAQRNATDELAQGLSELGKEAMDARRKVKEARIDFDIDKQRASMDLQREQARDAIDLEIEISQRRQDVARDSARAIEDIYRRHNQRLADTLLDNRRREYDILRKAARDEEEAARNEAREREKIEEDFQRRLEEIKRRFDFDAQEAIRANDAIAFLRIQRRKEFELEGARRDRDDSIGDAVEQAQERREKIREQLELELEDAKLAGERKLEDLRTQLANELQEQAIKNQREAEDLRIWEERKRAEQALTFKRQQEDFNIYWQRRLQDLQRNLQKELMILARYEREKTRILLESRAAGRMGGGRRDRSGDDDDSTAPTGPPRVGRYDKRQHGGEFQAFRSTLVGEDGPEVVQFNSGGKITPLNRYISEQATALRMSPNAFTSQVSRSTNNDFNINLVNPNEMSAAQRQFIQNFFMDLMYKFQQS